MTMTVMNIGKVTIQLGAFTVFYRPSSPIIDFTLVNPKEYFFPLRIIFFS